MRRKSPTDPHRRAAPGRTARARRPGSRPAARYHHGDLPRALLQEALRTIQQQGVEALTLRHVGARLGVSRTALYRHFASKQALLAAVANEGFRTLRGTLLAAYESGGKGRIGFEAMGLAYVRFALAHPSHYRVMFGRYLSHDDQQEQAGPEAFQVLVDAIEEEQRAGWMRDDDPLMLAVYIWSVVHGVAMLALDGMIDPAIGVEALTAFANERLLGGITRTEATRS